eukprot:2502189-Alexandrium_andersonii.AAC.1
MRMTDAHAHTAHASHTAGSVAKHSAPHLSEDGYTSTPIASSTLTASSTLESAAGLRPAGADRQGPRPPADGGTPGAEHRGPVSKA